jgi:hypothetical protein
MVDRFTATLVCGDLEFRTHGSAVSDGAIAGSGNGQSAGRLAAAVGNSVRQSLGSCGLGRQLAARSRFRLLPRQCGGPGARAATDIERRAAKKLTDRAKFQTLRTLS